MSEVNWPYHEPLEYDDDGDINTIDKAYTYSGWIEVLTILSKHDEFDSCHMDAEHDQIFLPSPRQPQDPIDPESNEGKRLIQLGCVWDEDNEHWYRFG